MKKIGILLGILIVMSIIPLCLALENVIVNITGNDSNLNIDTKPSIVNGTNYTQTTLNPKIGDNVTFVSLVNVTGDAIAWNLSEFYFCLPDNNTLTNETEFIVTNLSGVKANGSVFHEGARNCVNFSGLSDGDKPLFNSSINGSIFNITWILKAPIAQTKLTTVKSGRSYTETWNITSAASNMTIVNASLILEPTFWYTKVQNLTAITFNGTAVSTQNYVQNLTRIQVFTELNQSVPGNMIKYGSGSAVLSVTYNGPTVDQSSGSTPSKALAIVPTEAKTKLGLIVFALILSVVIIGGIVLLVSLKKR